VNELHDSQLVLLILFGVMFYHGVVLVAGGSNFTLSLFWLFLSMVALATGLKHTQVDNEEEKKGKHK